MNRRKRILIVEDDEDLVASMRLALSPLDCTIAVANEVAMALQMAQKEPPDLIILDVMYGSEEKTEGFDFARAIRQDPRLKAIPILMATAVHQTYPGFTFSPETDGEFLPVDAWIEKPFSSEAFLDSVRGLLGKESRWATWPEEKKV